MAKAKTIVAMSHYDRYVPFFDGVAPGKTAGRSRPVPSSTVSE